ncbi:MAG TPA: CHASE2 domain-containing protein, partial [Rubrivivax sp.]|nr:CHASE2 domain-containing protein [Rubrivivax sp.]
MKRQKLAASLSRKETFSILIVGLGLSLLVGLMGWIKPAPITQLDHWLMDGLQRASASGQVPANTVVIDIDDVSLSAVGQWPWPRYRVASLIQRVAAERPAAIALDILFAEPDRSSLLNIQQTFKHDFGLDIAFSGVPGGLMDNDGYLGDEIARGGVVASNYFYFDHVSNNESPIAPGLTFAGQTHLLRPHEATGVLVNAEPIASQTHYTGFVNHRLDRDGVLRRVPLLISHAGRLHPHLSLAASMRAFGVTTGSIQAVEDGLALRIGERLIPLDHDGSVMLRFNGRPQVYRSLSAVDVLNGRYIPGDLQGKIVFIGSSAVGLNDHHTTAIAAHFPGLKIHSVISENILAGHFMSVPTWAAATGFFICLLAGILVSTMFVVASGIYPLVAGSVLTCAMLITASAIVFLRSGRFVSVAAPVLLVAALFIAFVLIRFAFEKRRAYLRQRQLEN